MVKKAEKDTAAGFAVRDVRFWPALLIGLLLLLTAVLLYGQIRQDAGVERLMQRLPKDSYVAGVSRLSVFTPETIKQLSAGARAGQDQLAPAVDALTARGATKDKLAATVDDQFAFASTPRGSLAVLSVRNEEKLPELVSSLQQTVANPTSVTRDGRQFFGGTLPGGATVTASRSGRELLLASNPELINQAIDQTDGFATIDHYQEVAERLPRERDGYLFYQPATVRTRVPLDLPLTGVAFTVEKEVIKLTARTADSPSVTERLPRADGELLPPVSQATASISGNNISRYQQLLEEQRQESEVPKVLMLQNGLNSLNRALGADFEREFLQVADGRFVYARYGGPAGNEWGGLLEFDSAEQAEQTVNRLNELVKQKVTVPIRREVITILPDGSQSREVVAEGRSPLGFAEFTSGGDKGQFTSLPGNFGSLFFLLKDRYLVLGSNADAIGRMLTTLATPAPAKISGELTVRAQLGGLGGLLRDQDALSDWLFATRPAGGTFSLDPATGELTGAVEFTEQ